MRLKHGLQLAYCTNIHRGETWAETFGSLQTCTLAVRDSVGSADAPFAIGLRLSDPASRELSDPETLLEFRRWLDRNHCYVFTLNGFPFGRFHSARVKEQVYRPDWTSPERLHYTKRLFDLISQLLPDGLEGSVSTLPGSFKPFITRPEQHNAIRENLWACLEHISALSRRTGKMLHLGLEPEPFGLFENTPETLQFFAGLAEGRAGDDRLAQHLGVNYDCCHFALQYEDPAQSIGAFQRHGIRISKVHLSSALRVRPDSAHRDRLKQFNDDVYLHQVIARTGDRLARFADLPEALADASPAEEWRVHFHVPLYMEQEPGFGTTADHLLGTLDCLARDPALCSHLEMETYTWEVLPPELRSAGVVEQLSREYQWTLARCRERNLA